MSFYGTSVTSARAGPRSVWPFYALAVFTILIMVMAISVFWPKNIPGKDELVMTGGKMRTVRIRDDLSNTSAGAMLPILTSVYFRFKDIEGEFRYPWTFPSFRRVRDRTAVFADIWVEKAALGRDETPLIWGLEEHNHFKEEDDQTIVLYEDLVKGQKENARILTRLCLVLSAAAAVFALIGFGVGRWNRKKYPDYYS